MKASKTILFILGVLLGLALICLLFPRHGISIGPFHLKFPPLSEVLAVEQEDSTAQLTPEQLLQQRQDALNAEKIDEFRQYCKTNPARIYMPKGDETYLDGFFDLLQDARNQHVRILHYGDSQIECDRITSYLRQEFQQQFGGSGVGLIPALQTVPTYTIVQSITPGAVPQYMPYGPTEKRGTDTAYGPMTKVTHIPDSATIEFSGVKSKDYSCSRNFNQLTVITSGSARLTLTTNQGSATLRSTAEGGLHFYSARLPRSAHKGTIHVTGGADILGIQLDGDKGISIDNIPMRGCTGAELTKIDRSTLDPFFRRENIGLVILQYGGNSVPDMEETRIPAFRKQVHSTIRLIKELKPEARILFIGPSDMATKTGGSRMHTWPILPAMVKAIREVASEEGIAFWSMYDAMGGEGSMVKWVNAQPPLAAKDYVHFTAEGAKNVADMLYRTLQFYYKFYRYRTGQDNVQLTASDSLLVDSLKQK